MQSRTKKFIFIISVAVTCVILLILLKIKLGSESVRYAVYQNQAMLFAVPDFRAVRGSLYIVENHQEEKEAVDEENDKQHIEDNTKKVDNHTEQKKSKSIEDGGSKAKDADDDISIAELTIEDNVKDDNLVVDKAKVAIIVTNLGLSKATTLRALELPNNITLGFSPYASNLQEWLDHAAYKKYISLVNLPMQPANYPIDDPGPYALLHNLSIKENIKNLRDILKKAKRTIGVYTSIGEEFTTSIQDMQPIFKELKKYNRSFIYGDFKNNKVLQKMAYDLSLKYSNISVIIDKTLTAEDIDNNLHKLEIIANAKKSAIGIMSAYPINITALEKWIKTLPQKNITIVPINYMFKQATENKEAVSAKANKT